MAEYTISATCDLDEGVRMVRLGRLFAQNDKLAHTITTIVKENDAAADLTGLSANCYFIRPDDATVTIPSTISGSSVSVTLPAACYEVPGRFSMIVKVYDSTHAIPIFWGDGTITRAETDSIVDPARVVPDLAALLAQIETIDAAVTAAGVATQAANTAAGKLENMTVAGTSGATPGATVSTVDGHYHIAFVMEKGDKGDTGNTGATGNGISTTEVKYKAGASATAVPSGDDWYDSPSAAGVQKGQFLWTRIVLNYTGTSAVTVYTVSYLGVDGTGTTPFGGATQSTAGTSGWVPAPDAGEQGKFLCGNGDWENVPSYTDATQSTSGLMSATDKTKLDGVDAGANHFILTPATANDLGGIKVGDNLTIDANGKLSAQSAAADLELVWENGDPDLAYTGKKETIDLSGYEGVVIEYRLLNTRAYTARTDVVPIYSGGIMRFNTVLVSQHGGRVFTVLPTGIIFEDAHRGDTAAQNVNAVPVFVFGVKSAPKLIPMTDASNDYVLTRFDPSNGDIHAFTATKDKSGRNANYCGWLYSDIGLGFTLISAAAKDSYITMVSDETIDLTDYDTITMRVAYKGYGSYNYFGLVSHATYQNIDFSASNSESAQSGWFAQKQQITTSANTFAMDEISFDVSGLTGSYHLAAMTAGSGQSNYTGKTCIMEAYAS